MSGLDNGANNEAVLLSAKQVAQLLQVSTRTLWRLLSSGQLIMPVRLGRSVRWRKQELMTWMDVHHAHAKMRGSSRNGLGIQKRERQGS